jgi:hypothetical protein
MTCARMLLAMLRTAPCAVCDIIADDIVNGSCYELRELMIVNRN